MFCIYIFLKFLLTFKSAAAKVVFSLKKAIDYHLKWAKRLFNRQDKTYWLLQQI